MTADIKRDNVEKTQQKRERERERERESTKIIVGIYNTEALSCAQIPNSHRLVCRSGNQLAFVIK